MRLVEQWRRIRADLPAEWGSVTLTVAVPRAEQRPRAASLLGPAAPGRLGDDLRLSVYRAGGGIGPDQAAKLFGKVDAEKIRATLTLVAASERTAAVEPPRTSIAAAWQAAVDTLPPDWSDLHAELALTSSDHVDQAALLLAPINPTREPGRSALRFRVARSFGYGGSPEMTKRCFERVDAEGIPGRPVILRALSDTHNADTQGPVWRVAGKAV
jgi:hypothetical protein